MRWQRRAEESAKRERERKNDATKDGNRWKRRTRHEKQEKGGTEIQIILSRRERRVKQQTEGEGETVTQRRVARGREN